MAVLEVSAVLGTARVELDFDRVQIGAEVAALTLNAELIKPQLDLDDPSAV